MTNVIYVFFIALLGNMVALSAPLFVPIALLFTGRNDTQLPSAFAWYDTPDEPELFGLYEETVNSIYSRFGWFFAAYYWFGFRNTGHGFKSMFARRANRHWVGDWNLSFSVGNAKSYSDTGEWISVTRKGRFIFIAGWQVYSSKKYDTGLEYRPILSVKNRPLRAA